MQRPALIAALALAPCFAFAADTVGDEALRVVERQSLEFDSPAKRIPSDKMVDGPLLGNGDLGVTIAGAPEALRFHIGKNDFWGLKTKSPQTVGRLEISTPALAGAPYKASCDMLRARWTGDFAKNDSALRVSAFMDANDNTLFLELNNAGTTALPVGVRLARGTEGVTGVPNGVAASSKPTLLGCEQHGAKRWYFRGETADFNMSAAALTPAEIAGLAKKTRGASTTFDGRTAFPFEAPKAGNLLSISTWVKASATTAHVGEYLVSQGDWNEGASLGLSNGRLRFTVNGKYLESPEALPRDRWVHVAAVFGDGKRMGLFVDGKQVAPSDDEKRLAFSYAPDGEAPGARRIGVACRILPGAGVTISDNGLLLERGAKAVIALAALSDLDVAGDAPFKTAPARVAVLTPETIATRTKAHEAWWEAFWKKSFIEIPDKKLERHWYTSQYVMASCSRAGKVAPGLWGNWITQDKTAWHGDYHLNYNFQSPFYCLYAANHPEVAEPFYVAMNDAIPLGQSIAQERGWKGINLPTAIGPWGRTIGGRGDYGQRSNAAYSSTNYLLHWRLTRDTDWLRKTGYPYLREVERFWTDYLKFDGARYVIEHDAIHEGSGGAKPIGKDSADFNPILSLGLVRSLYAGMLDTSGALGLDADLRPKWRDILAKLSAFPKQERGGKTVFRYTEQGTAWWGDNTLGIQHIFPAGAIGLDSDPQLLQISRDTIDAMNRWRDYNGSSNWYTACVRVGYDPEKTLAGLRSMYDRHAMPNGIPNFDGGGIENTSPTLAITEMLMQSHEGVLRLFPCWPKNLDARFGTLRASGAFLVSAQLRGGQIGGVNIESEKGVPLTVQNPWPGKAVRITRNGKAAETISGERFTLKTAIGETLELKAQ